MVLAVKPLRALLKLPELTVFCKKLFANVGLAEVLQQTPHADTVAPPLKVTAPPLLAEVLVIEDTAVVVTVGITIARVVKLTTFP
jgi:hypothetical protein